MPPVLAVLALSIAATGAGATGLYLTKSLTLRLPPWQTVGPLFLLNGLWAAVLIPFGPTWLTFTPGVLLLHAASAVVLCGTTACVFALVVRGRPSGAAVGQALSPAGALLAAPILLGVTVSPLELLGAGVLMAGALIPLRRSFDLGSTAAIGLLAGLGLGTGGLTVLSAMLFERGAGIAEIYIVRVAVAAVVYLILFWPRDLSRRDLPFLATRSFFITASFLLTIAAVGLGSVILIQSVLATLPLVVLIVEWLRQGSRPQPAVLVGSLIATGGLILLLRAL
ncbi:MAG: hypothetical protein KGP10_00500 [Actinomycetales bacterium]|nr:hypothetical protein [Actinomycetales bacterium]